MVETLSVSVSGPAFSFLLYENVKSDFDQEGFLLGEIVEKETNTITDNDEQVIKIDRIIKVTSVVPCPRTCYFYDGAGRIDPKKIANLLGEQFLKIVAWYKFKHTNAFKLTLREKIIHKQLAKLIGSTPELFVCCLLTTDSSTNGSTHLYSQTFLRHCDASYQMLPMHIVNLSDPNNTYKSPEPCSDTFNTIIKSLHVDKNKSHGFIITTKIQTALQKHIDQVVIKLTDSEKRLFALSDEIKDLRQKVQDKQDQEKSVKDAKESSDPLVDYPCENGSDDGNISLNLSSNSKETSPEVVHRITRGQKRGSKQMENKNARHSSSSPIKNDICLDNSVDNKIRLKPNYAQAAQKSKN